MANGRVDFAVSCTPIFTHTNVEGPDIDVIASDIGKSVGGSGSIDVTWGSADPEGYANGSPVYTIATTTLSTSSLLTTANEVLFIKHTGYEDSNQSIATDEAVFIYADTIPFAKLSKGMALVLPLDSGATTDIKIKTDTGDVAVEYFAI